VGSFSAGGSGTIIGGLETYNEVGKGGAKQHTFLGNYDIGLDGRGTMEFCEDISANTCPQTAATVFFRVAIISAQQVQIIEYSKPGNSIALTTASGEMILQDISVFKTAGLIGAYSFDFSGFSSVAIPASLSAVGEFSTDGRGLISTSVISSIPGRMDINNGGTLSQPVISNTSSYSIKTNGQGTATVLLSGDPNFPQLKFDVYMVSASRAMFIESDGVAVLSGDAVKQQTATCSWGPASLGGLTTLETSGTTASGSVTDLISFTPDGFSITTVVSNNENKAGAVTSGTTLAGNYTIDSCGKGTLSLSGPANHSYVFYLISPSSAVIQETTAGVVGDGLMVKAQTGPVSLGALNSFAINLAGTNAAGAAAMKEDIVGQLNVGSTGSLVANPAGSFGSLDINNSDSLGTTQTVALTSGTLTTSGPSTLTLNSTGSTRTFVLYFVSPTQFFVMGTDSTGVAIGSLYQQF